MSFVYSFDTQFNIFFEIPANRWHCTILWVGKTSIIDLCFAIWWAAVPVNSISIITLHLKYHSITTHLYTLTSLESISEFTKAKLSISWGIGRALGNIAHNTSIGNNSRVNCDASDDTAKLLVGWEVKARLACIALDFWWTIEACNHRSVTKLTIDSNRVEIWS